MVTIRLSRYGRKKAPFYRIVAVDSTKKATGEVLEFLGFWNPKNKETKFEKEKIQAWIKKGAKLSATVEKLFK